MGDSAASGTRFISDVGNGVRAAAMMFPSLFVSVFVGVFVVVTAFSSVFTVVEHNSVRVEGRTSGKPESIAGEGPF